MMHPIKTGDTGQFFPSFSATVVLFLIPTGTPSEQICVVLSCTPVHQSFVHRADVPTCVPALVYVPFGATLKRRR